MNMSISVIPPLAKPSFKRRSLFLTYSLLMSTSVFADDAAICGSFVKEAVRSTPNEKSVPKEKCPISHTFVKWLSVQKKGTFEEVRNFIRTHPKWPRQTNLRKQAEKDMAGRKLATKDILDWFETYPPLTAAGLKVYAQAIMDNGKSAKALAALETAFLSLDASGNEIKSVITSKPSAFTKTILFQKVTQYLNKGDSTSTRELIPLLSPMDAKVAQIRLNLQAKDVVISTTIQPAKDLKLSDIAKKGLLLERIRAHRKAEQNDEAKALLADLKLSQDKDEDDEEENLKPTIDSIAWAETAWTERNLIARRYLEEASYQKAYDILQGHGLTKGENFANAEFLSGWISLRYLKKPEAALRHFEKLNAGVKSPISAARARYWLAKTHHALGDKESSKEWYDKAKIHKATYYGQLAHKEVTGQAPTFKPTALPVDATVRDRFHKRDLVKAIKMLADIREIGYIDSFALAVSEEIEDHKEQSLLVDLLHNRVSKSSALHLYKKTAKEHAPLIPSAYPRVDHVPSNTISSAFAHAIIRQESRFQHDAMSTAGAQGLMQLMPATAARTVKTHKLKAGKLTDPQHNVMVGCLHLKELLEKYNGSMILAAAAYNAGSGPVDKWLALYGDPRQPGVDVIDWVENIPYGETRNYVQRIMENYHCYG